MANDWNVMAAMMQGGMYGPNPYSQFQGRIPMAGYTGWPTDAMGNPIQKPPGMTLNSLPAQQAAPPPPSTTLNSSPFGAIGDQIAGWQSLVAPELSARGDTYGDPYLNQVAQTYQQRHAAAPAPQPAAGNPSGLTSDQYLSLLANPGKVTTPGAQMQASSQPSVLQSFLANAQGGRGAGNYDNSAFFNTLNRLSGGGAAQSGSGMQGGGGFPGFIPPGTPDTPKDAAVQGYLDSSGRPTAMLASAMQPFVQRMQQLRGQ